MASVKEIRRRIKSIQNTKKITRAMEMVSASKMRRSVNKVLATRSYANASWEILTSLSESYLTEKHPLLEIRPVKKICIILITSNRGLCGSFNAQIIKKVFDQIKNPALLKINRARGKKLESNIADKEIVFDFITVGKKGAGFVQKLGKKIIATFDDLNYWPNILNIRPLAKLVIDDYTKGIYDKVVIAYTDYLSPIAQKPLIRQLLPLSTFDLEKQIAELKDMAKKEGIKEEVKSVGQEYLFEPTAEIILSELISRLIEMQIYRGILESNASKEAARMLAMQNATEAAGEIIMDLTLAYNKSRQASITREIIEVSAGAIKS